MACRSPVSADSLQLRPSALHHDRYCVILRLTTNPHDRRGLTIWLEGEKAGASRFFRFWSTINAGIA